MGESSVREMLAGGYALALLLAGIYVLQRVLREEFNRRPGNPLPAWNGRWLEFLFLIALLGFLTIALPVTVIQATGDWKHNPALDPWRGPLSALALQSGMLVAIGVLTLGPHRLIRLDFSPGPPGPPHPVVAGATDFLASFPLVVAVSLGWNGLLSALERFGYPVPMEPQPLLGLFQDSPLGVVVTLTLMAVLLAPLSEELVFRGLLYRFLKGRFSPRVALITSALLFAWLHGNLRSFLPLCLLGLLFCRTYERRQSILASMTFHALFNANTILLLLLGGDSMNQF